MFHLTVVVLEVKGKLLAASSANVEQQNCAITGYSSYAGLPYALVYDQVLQPGRMIDEMSNGARLAIRPRWLPLTVVMILCVVGGVFVFSGQFEPVGNAGAVSPFPSPPSHRHSSATYHGPYGIPAIPARPELAQSTGPHFTEADARQYLATHSEVEYVVPGSPTPVLTSVRFMTTSQASAVLQESLALPDTTLVCLARYAGSFQGAGGPFTANQSQSIPVEQSETLIFDAHTGNLLSLMLGG